MTTVTDLPLFGYARRTDPGTSHAAAASVDVTPLEAHVVGALKAYPDGLTTHELADIIRLSLVTISPRMAPLRDKGLVEDSGIKRAGSSGRLSIVWKMRKSQ